MLTHLFLFYSLSLPYFILAVPMRKCLGKHSCMSSSFPIVILYDTSFFRQCNYKCTKENSVRDGDTSQCTSNPVSTELNSDFTAVAAPAARSDTDIAHCAMLYWSGWSFEWIVNAHWTVRKNIAPMALAAARRNRPLRFLQPHWMCCRLVTLSFLANKNLEEFTLTLLTLTKLP